MFNLTTDVEARTKIDFGTKPDPVPSPFTINFTFADRRTLQVEQDERLGGRECTYRAHFSDQIADDASQARSSRLIVASMTALFF